MFVHGHGGNAAPANAAVDRLHQEGRRVLSWFPRTHHDSHAGHDETSIMLHLAPDLVRIDQVAPGNTAPLRELMPELRAHGLREVSESGVLGDPTTATAAAGDKIWHDLVDQLLRAYDDWRLDAT